jgi:hypothetical protein
MMHVNTVARVGPAPIHAALTAVSGALGSLISARGAIVDCHGELVTAKGKVPGLRTVAFGDEECPPASGMATLRAVA